jgi:hypothetical protein
MGANAAEAGAGATADEAGKEVCRHGAVAYALATAASRPVQKCSICVSKKGFPTAGAGAPDAEAAEDGCRPMASAPERYMKTTMYTQSPQAESWLCPPPTRLPLQKCQENVQKS